MGFDNECIVNMQSLQGEYFCPVCRLLVYPNEALQTQCTHLYCKPCLAYIVGSTRACPYDGYLVTEADTKPLVEVNKPVADAIGQIPVHCLYYRSGCSWQGSLSECTAHCSGCAFGNSPVVCNRCSTQIVHRQVQEHALNCPGVPPRTAQADSTLPSSVELTQTTGLEPGSQSAKVLTSVQGHTQGNSVVQAQVAVPTSQVVSQVSSYEQWYQQYYQQHPGYGPQQQYAQYYPYQQQQFPQQQTQPQGQYVLSGQQAQSYMQHQPQPQPQPQVLLPSQSQAKNQQQGLSQPQPTNPQLPIAVQPQMQAQVNSQQPQTQPPLNPQPLAQMQPQVQLPTQAAVGFSNASNLQTRPQIFQLRNHSYVPPQPRSNMLPQPSSQQASIQQPRPQQPPQPQNSSSHAVTGHQSYPQPLPNQQMLPAIQQQHAHHQGVPQHPPNQIPTHFPSHQPPIRPYHPPPQNHMPVPHLQQPTFTSQGQHLTNSHQSFPVQPPANHIPPHHLPQHQSQHYQLQGAGGQYAGQQVAPFVPQQTMQSQQSGHFPASYYAHSQPHLQQNNIGSQSVVSHQSTKPIPVNEGSSQQFTSDSLAGASKFSEGQIKSDQAVHQPSIPVSDSQHEFVIENEQLASQNSVRSPSQLSAAQFPPTKDGNQPDKTGQAFSLNVASSSQKGMSNVDHPNAVLSSSQSEGNISKVKNDSQESKPLTDTETKPAVRDGEDDVTLGKTIGGKLMDKSNGISVFSDKEGKMFMPTANGKPSSVTETSSHRHATSGVTGAADPGHAQHDQDMMHFAHHGLPGYQSDEVQGIRPEQMQGNSYTQSGYTLTRRQNMAGGPPRPLHDGVLQADHGRWSGEGQFPYPRERQLYGPNVEVPSGVLPGHDASTTFSSGPLHMAPPHMPCHDHGSSLGDPFSGPSLGGLVHGTFDPSGSLRGRIPPLHGRDSHTGLPIPDIKDYSSGAQDSSQEKRCKHPIDDRLMPIPNEGFQARPDDQIRPSSIGNDGSIRGKSDFREDLKQFPRPIHLGDENFFASRSINRPFSSYAGPHMYKADIEGRPRFRNDGMGRSDTPEFFRHTSDFGPLRSQRRDYPYQAGRFGSGPFPGFGGRLHLDNYDDRDFYGLGDRTKHFSLHPDVGNSFTRTRIPFSAPSWHELEGPNAPGQLRAEEPFTHFRGGERLGFRGFGSNFRSREHLGSSNIRGPVDVGGPPRLFSVHPRFGEPLGSHMHLKEAGFRSYLSQDFPKNGAHNQDNFEPFIQSRKKKPGSMGWCRICKVDCGTVDNLELHAQTKEHQKEAMDIVLSVKMESAKRQKNSSEDQVAEDNSNESQKASNESMGKGLSAVDDS